MAAYKMTAVKVTPPNDIPLVLRRSHMVVIHLFLMLCDLQRMVRELCPTCKEWEGTYAPSCTFMYVYTHTHTHENIYV
jgi:hypothetical protein